MNVAVHSVGLMCLATFKRQIHQRQKWKHRASIIAAVVFIIVKVVYYCLWVPDSLYTHFHIDEEDIVLTIYARWLGYLIIFHIMDLIRITIVVCTCTYMHFVMKKRALKERLRLEALETGSEANGV